MEQLFANTWIYVGHDSQVPKVGDYYATTIGTQPVIMVRDAPDSVTVLHNRCPHKGTRITGDTCGNVGRFFRCPYHAWTFRLDGSLAGVPLKSGYDNTGFADGHAARGMTQVRHVHNYRGFVFGKLSDIGPGFEEFFGEALVQPRQHDRPLAGREARGRGRRAALHARLQLEDAGREPDRHLPSDDRASIVGRHGDRGVEVRAARHQEADGGRDLRAVHELIRVLPDHGHPGLGQRPRPYRRVALDPFRLFGGAGLLRADDGSLWRGARQGDPRREPPQHRLLPQRDAEGADPAPAPVQADRRRTRRWSRAGRSGWSVRPTCCWSARSCTTG